MGAVDANLQVPTASQIQQHIAESIVVSNGNEGPLTPGHSPRTQELQPRELFSSFVSPTAQASGQQARASRFWAQQIELLLLLLVKEELPTFSAMILTSLWLTLVVTQSQPSPSQQPSPAKLENKIKSTLRRYAKGIQQRFKIIESKVYGIQKQLAELQTEKGALWQELRTSKDAVHVARTTRAEDLPRLEGEARFRRPLRKNVMVDNFPQPVPRAVFEDLIRPRLEERQISEEQWMVEGPASGLAKRWMVVFQGTPAFGADLTDKTYRSLRNADGSWRQFFAVTPGKRCQPCHVGYRCAGQEGSGPRQTPCPKRRHQSPQVRRCPH